MKPPEKNIPVLIRKGLIVYTDDVRKIKAIRIKYKDK